LKVAFKFLSVLFLLSSLAACGGEDTGSEDKEEKGTKQVEENTEEMKTEEVSSEEQSSGEINVSDLVGKWTGEDGDFEISHKDNKISMIFIDLGHKEEIIFEIGEIIDRTVNVVAREGDGLRPQDVNLKGAFELSEDQNELIVKIMEDDEMEEDMVLTRNK
jgi:hypothetical protein